MLRPSEAGCVGILRVQPASPHPPRARSPVLQEQMVSFSPSATSRRPTCQRWAPPRIESFNCNSHICLKRGGRLGLLSDFSTMESPQNKGSRGRGSPRWALPFVTQATAVGLQPHDNKRADSPPRCPSTCPVLSTP